MSTQAITKSRYVHGKLRNKVTVVLRAVKWSGLGSVWHFNIFRLIFLLCTLTKSFRLLWLAILLTLFSKWALFFEKVILQKSYVRFFYVSGQGQAGEEG